MSKWDEPKEEIGVLVNDYDYEICIHFVIFNIWHEGIITDREMLFLAIIERSEEVELSEMATILKSTEESIRRIARKLRSKGIISGSFPNIKLSGMLSNV